jgi:drug/metabolite transporter superfamily protein YnfA
MANVNALLMSDMEIAVTLLILAAAALMLVGFTPDRARAARAGRRIALYAGLAIAAAAGFAWTSLPPPIARAPLVTLAGG